MKLQIRTRLSVMMFLEYFIWGAWYVTLGTWLSRPLHFTGQQIGLAAGATSVGAILAPFFVGLIADRLFATQKVLSLLHILGAALLLAASVQNSFGVFYSLILLYSFCLIRWRSGRCRIQRGSSERSECLVRVGGSSPGC